MTKQIMKRNTFKEAFADVLKLSHKELISHSVDPFIREAFNCFEQMDCFDNKDMDLPKPDFGLCILENLQFTKKYSINNLLISVDMPTVSNYSHVEITGNFIESEREVSQWVLAA